MILKLEQAPESPIGFVRTQSYGPYPRIFDLWPGPENIHFSKLPVLLWWTTQSEKHSLKIFWSHEQVSILFEKPGQWKHREDVLVCSLRLLRLSLNKTGTHSLFFFAVLARITASSWARMLVHLSYHSYCSFHIGIPSLPMSACGNICSSGSS